jgi:thiamine biosynthesis protein ThiS
MRVNGKNMPFAGMTIRDIIASNGLREDRVAVELNGKIVPRSEYACIFPKDGDSVEIVGFVGGG